MPQRRPLRRGVSPQDAEASAMPPLPDLRALAADPESSPMRDSMGLIQQLLMKMLASRTGGMPIDATKVLSLFQGF